MIKKNRDLTTSGEALTFYSLEVEKTYQDYRELRKLQAKETV